MKIVVYGLWHLGSVTAACLARLGHEVVGLEEDHVRLAALASGRAPLFEPGLDALLADGLKSGRLSFTGDEHEAVRGARVLWVAFDTPVDAFDNADTEFVLSRVRAILPALEAGTVVLISSQLPVGSCEALQNEADRLLPGRGLCVACSPENLRLGKAIEVFEHPDRVVVGVPNQASRAVLEEMLKPLSAPVEWMSVASAEMVKHAINSFLALSVVFMNEIAWLCERHGADAREVERGLKTESRIGKKAYVKPGAAFAGGTLARDLMFLTGLNSKDGRKDSVFAAAIQSNARHRQWPEQTLAEALGGLKGKKIAVLGLAYKAGTSTLRRSEGLELALHLRDKGAEVAACDPLVDPTDPDLRGLKVFKDTAGALKDCQAVAVMNDAPQWKELPLAELARKAIKPVIVDPAGWVADQVPFGLPYCRVGYKAGRKFS